MGVAVPHFLLELVDLLPELLAELEPVALLPELLAGLEPITLLLELEPGLEPVVIWPKWPTGQNLELCQLH